MRHPVHHLRQQYDDMFNVRIERHPETLSLGFWENHFCTRQAIAGLSGRILDVGCGTGEIDIHLARAGHTVVGCDVSSVALSVARRHLHQEAADVQQRVKFLHTDAVHLPFPNGSFDSVLLSHVLEHVSHPTPMLKEIVRLLKPNGILLLLVPHGKAFPDATHVHFFQVETLHRLLSHFFEEVEVLHAAAEQQLQATCRNRKLTYHPRIVCQMRIKNEERWLKEVLDRISLVADGIVVLDDGSTDASPEICKSHPAVVEYRWQDETVLDEVRDKNALLKMTLAHNPEWVLCMDGDEILEDSSPERIFEAIRRCPDDVSILDLEFLYLWNDRQHYRTDGIYGRIFHHRMFRLQSQDRDALSFAPSPHGGNLHCESVPSNLRGRSMPIDVKVKHLGYMYPADRERKHLWYLHHDPDHARQGYYDHLLDQPGMAIAEWEERPFRRPAEGVVEPALDASRKQEHKPGYYYSQARRNLADLVPPGTKRLLDVGCGSGATGALIQSRGIEVVGIELHEDVAAQAEEHLSKVLVGDVETMELPFAAGWFDCILLGDVLEHLVNPWTTLRRLTKLLSVKGTLIASLPNVRNLGVIRKLLDGSWHYEEQGILDKTHLRFFAKRDMLALFEQAGLDAKVVEVVRDARFEVQMKSPPAAAIDVELDNLTLRQVDPSDLDELTAQQFIFIARIRHSEPQIKLAKENQRIPAASVIIPVYNNLEYTRQCITSLFAVEEKTDFEVIVVDNGSTDGTAEYLKQLPAPVRVVSIAENLGFAKGCNRGAAEARGTYLVFLNNDTIVLPGWLSAMVKCIKSDSEIGLVGNLQIFPDSRKVQQAGIVCRSDKIVYSIYSNELPADHPAVNKPREFQFVAGSCMLIERELFLRLGGFDEAYLNSCEDIDLCMKVRASGRKVFYCHESRIFHYESRTVTGHPKNGHNYRRFLDRWKDRLIPDDTKYLQEDGFLPCETTCEIEEKTPVISANASYPTVALLTTYNQQCGLSTYAEFLLRALETQGITPLVLAEECNDRRGPDSARTIRCWTRAADGGKRVFPLLQQHNIQVLHVNHGGIFALDGWLKPLLRAVRDAGIRTVITLHSTETLSEKLGELCRMSDRVLVHQPQNELELIALDAPLDRIEVVPHGMPAVEIRDLFESKLAIGWDPAIKVVSTFGFVEPHKGTLELIEAMRLVSARTGAHLQVLGGAHPNNPESQGYLDRCQKRAVELGLNKVVHFSNGFVPEEDIASFLRASDVIVLNYRHQRFESSGAAMLALSSGRPLVTTPVPSFEWATDFTFKTTAEFSLAETIVRVLENPFVARRLLDHALEYEKRARWDVIAERIARVYREVTSQPARNEISLMHHYRSHPDDIYAEPLQRERVRWLKSKAERRILEIGPANGYVSQFVGASVAVDINRGRLAVAGALRPNVQFEYGNVVEGLPFADREFDQVMAPEILEHVEFEEAVTALKECCRIGRRVLLTLPNADKPDYDPDLVHNIEHRWLVNRQAVDSLLRQAGCRHYELDVSEGLDFYQLDIRTDLPNVCERIHHRAATLPSASLVPGESLHIGVDVSALEDAGSRNRGIGRYMMGQFDELLRLRPHWEFTMLGTEAKPAVAEVRYLAERGKSYRSWSELTSQSLPDVLYLPHPMGSVSEQVTSAFLRTNVLMACTFHDLIPLVFPEAYLNPDPQFKTAYLQQLARLKQRCDLFFCNSQYTAQDLQRYLQIPLARLRIVHAGVSVEFERPPLPESHRSTLSMHELDGKRFLLFVGVPDYRKNAAPMIFALSAARQVLKEDLHLVIAGDVPLHLVHLLRRMAHDCSLPDPALHITGFVSESELNVLYHGALGLLFPSLYEGFGFPIVEAMAAGLPVIAANNSSQPEIAGDAAVLVEARDITAIARAIVALCQSEALREELRRKGLKQYRRFTWKRVAEKTAIYLAEAMCRRKGIITPRVTDSESRTTGVVVS